jgi:hypothetical protein
MILPSSRTRHQVRLQRQFLLAGSSKKSPKRILPSGPRVIFEGARTGAISMNFCGKGQEGVDTADTLPGGNG